MNKIKNINNRPTKGLNYQIVFEFVDGNGRKIGLIRIPHKFDSLEDKELFLNAHWEDYFYTWTINEDSKLAEDMKGILNSAYAEYHLVSKSEENISLFEFVGYMLEKLKEKNL